MSEFIFLRFKAMLKEEVIAFGPGVKKIVDAFDPATIGLKPVLDAMEEQWKKLEPFLENKKGSVLTDDVTLLDDLRDTDLKGIKSLAEAFLKHRNQEKRDAAQLIINTMDGFDADIPRQALPVQTETIKQLVAKLETDTELVAAVAQLNLAEWLAPLKATNLEFENIYSLRIEKEGEKPDTNFLVQKPLAENAYLAFQKRIIALNEISPNPKYDQIISQINELVGKYNQLVAQRQAANKKKRGGDEEAPKA